MRTLVTLVIALLTLPANAELPDRAIARCGSMAWRHPGGIESLTYAGGQLVGAGPVGVRFWDAEGKTRRLIGSGASRVVASPDGKTVLAAGTSLRWIDVASGKVTRELPVKTEGYSSCAWSPDGRTVYAGTGRGALMAIGSDAAIRWRSALRGGQIAGLFAAADGTRLRTLYPSGNGIYRVAWSSDGTMLASGGENASLIVWRADGKRLYQTPTAQLIGSMPVVGVAFTRNAVVYGIGHVDRIRLLRIYRDGAASPRYRRRPRTSCSHSSRESNGNGDAR